MQEDYHRRASIDHETQFEVVILYVDQASAERSVPDGLAVSLPCAGRFALFSHVVRGGVG